MAESGQKRKESARRARPDKGPGLTTRSTRPGSGDERGGRASRRGQTYRVGQTTRESIVRAAQAVLVEQGHAKFTVQRVAAKLGISPGNVNYYFPTKASLLETLIVYTLSQYRKRVRSAGESIGTGTPAALRDVLRWLMEDSLSEWTTRLFRQLWAIASQDARIAVAMDRFYTRSIHAYLRRVGVRGPTPQSGLDLEAIIYLVHMLSEGTIVLFGTRAGSSDLFERVRAVADRALVQLIQSESSG